MNASILWYIHAMGHVSDQKKWYIKSWKDVEEPEIHIGKLKRIVCKGCILHDSKYLTFWKRWNYRGNKNSNAQSLARVGEIAKAWKILRQCEYFQDTVMVATWQLSNAWNCTVDRNKPGLNCGTPTVTPSDDSDPKLKT